MQLKLSRRERLSVCAWKVNYDYVVCVYLETLLPQEILEAWFFSFLYACCEEGLAGGEPGADRDLSRLSWDDSVFWRDFQFS